MADSSSVSEPNQTSSPIPSQVQPFRIHFPDRFLTTRTHGDSSRSSSLSFASPAQLMLQSRSDNSAATDLTESRRRVRSLGLNPIASSSKTSKSTLPRHHGSRRQKGRAPSQSSPLSPAKTDPLIADFEPGAFSDEYDLSHEDPRILQDVQRALNLQSRRRERVSQQLHPISDDVPPSTDIPIPMSVPYASTSTASPAPHPSPQHLQAHDLPSEVDFSPSTRSVPPHPVPLSSNGGATLDWTGSQSEDEKLDRRWSISRGKRKGKERTIPANKAVVEKQEALFTDKLLRIRTEASASTLRKAAIVSEQLERRYNILYVSIVNGDPVALTQIAHWHATLGTETQAWLDSAEPMSWLKHLVGRRGKQRSQWHVSALIVEEYVKFKKGVTSSTPLPESLAPSSSLETRPLHHPLEPATGQTSGPPPNSSSSTSLGRARSSDGRISFGPLVANVRDSRDNSTRGEGKSRGWRQSIPVLFDSGNGDAARSPYHHRNSSGGLSPASSRLNFPDIIHRFRRHPAESEEGSSPFGSQSEDQDDSLGSGPLKRRKWKDELHMDGLQLPRETIAEDDPFTCPLPVDSTSATFPSHPNQDIDAPREKGLSQPSPFQSKRSHRSTSLPFLPPSPHSTPSSAQEKFDEDSQLEAEYEQRLRILEELKDHNHRLRQRTLRATIGVREYDLVCSNVMPSLGIAYRGLPTDLMDAFNLDPSAATGRMRMYTGWRAVEDIHARVLRQRDNIARFLSGVRTDNLVLAPDDILDNPIATLMEKLQALEREREPLQRQAEEVAQKLMDVRACHMAVKAEYNDALSYTSVVYPQLSHIAVLEESYKDHYQQVWELGMDALTLILDTIAPFWRSYGKIIGEDMQDFIIIPWYRNEFTGEPKRYLVKSVPRRSLRHWVALLSLCTLTFFVTFLQARAAITLAWHYRLLWIDNQAFRWTIMPFFWVVILIQWLALIFEICVIFLYVAVVLWWLGWFVGICT